MQKALFIFLSIIAISITIIGIYQNWRSKPVKKQPKIIPSPLEKRHNILRTLGECLNHIDQPINMKGQGFDIDGYISDGGDYIIVHKDASRKQFVCMIRKPCINLITRSV